MSNVYGDHSQALLSLSEDISRDHLGVMPASLPTFFLFVFLILLLAKQKSEIREM